DGDLDSITGRAPNMGGGSESERYEEAKRHEGKLVQEASSAIILDSSADDYVGNRGKYLRGDSNQVRGDEMRPN
ncbi:MAG TPA: hypothetical protein VGS41_04120, partial [Chthonomonadales bacterium]|nr:hypothetical protein [Chthonomonadales bacterium]